MSKSQRNKQFAQLVGGLLNKRGAGLKVLDFNDAAMQAAIRDFQTANGFKPTGLADDRTFRALRKPVASLTITGSAGTGNTGATASGTIKPVDPNAAQPGEFAGFSQAMQDNAAKNPNVAVKLREMQLADAQQAADKGALRSPHNDRYQNHPNFPPPYKPDFAAADPWQARHPSVSFQDHNTDVTLSRAITAKAQALRDSSIDMTLGVNERPQAAAMPSASIVSEAARPLRRRRHPPRTLAAGG